MLGVVALAADEPGTAQGWLLRRLEEAPDDLIAQFFLGETYLRLEDTSAAIEQWEAMGAQNRLMQLARDLEQRRAPAEALEALAAVVRLDPTDVAARKLAAKICTKEGNLEQALALYQEIIALDPQQADGYALSGRVLFKAGQYEQAITFSEQALQRAPADPYWVLTVLGKSHAALGQWPEATAAYEGAIRADPTLPGAYDLWGDALYHQEQYEQAVVAYEEALRRDPAQPYWMLVKLGRSHAALGRWPEAAEAYQQAIREDSTVPNAYAPMGDAQCQIGHPGEARFYYEQAIALGNQKKRVRRAVEYIAQHGECPP
jgi:tetratricopeptide (TPR) repeat protein